MCQRREMLRGGGQSQPMYIDSHCHLTFPDLLPRATQILADMRAARVAAALTICTQWREVPDVLALAQVHPNVWASVGVHPDTEPDAGDVEPSVDDLVACARAPKVIAIGETGLDYFRLGGRSVADMQWQRDRFARHIQAACATALPLVIHTRSAAADTLAVLDAEGAGEARGVFHCFTESPDVARAALERGFYISFSGILSFKNAAQLRDVARLVPMDRCLIETDSPYLAPVPHRGKTNTPAWVPHVAQALADAKGLTLTQVAQATTGNFERLFAVSCPKEETCP